MHTWHETVRLARECSAGRCTANAEDERERQTIDYQTSVPRRRSDDRERTGNGTVEPRWSGRTGSQRERSFAALPPLQGGAKCLSAHCAPSAVRSELSAIAQAGRGELRRHRWQEENWVV